MTTNKMLGCRVSSELDKAVRERAKNEGKKVNDIMVELLNNGFNISPEGDSLSVTEITHKVRELKREIRDLEKSKPFFGDDDIQACIEALNVEIKQYLETLPVDTLSKSEKEEGRFTFV